MHEYEFRLVVEESTSFEPFIHSLGYPICNQIVYYMKPHFRFREGCFETKRKECTQAVYHDEMWFRWVHSVETPYSCWSKSTCFTFLHQIGNYQQPLLTEHRQMILLSQQAKLYTFKTNHQTYRLVFEWECGTFSKPQTRWSYGQLLHSLSQYRDIYHLLKPYTQPPFKLDEVMSRRTVTAVSHLPKENCLYALKIDGIFGLIFSYPNKIKEKWEGNECVVKKGISLSGDGFVFAAERVRNGHVYLLDVYQVQGYETAPWCRKQILTEFLCGLTLPEGYYVQRYETHLELLERHPPFETDGVIAHDIVKDFIMKLKKHHSVDLVFYNGYFYLPFGRFPYKDENLENGRVYEISIHDGRVLRSRNDRFKGNTAEQLEKILIHGWQGPPIEPLPTHANNRKKRKNS